MQIATQGSGDYSPRHELDRLPPTTAVDAGPSRLDELEQLTAIAKREIPGVNASAGLAQCLQADPESIFSFRRAGKVIGGIAFLHLNDSGHDALLLDAMDLKNPERCYLARADERVAAIYVWALAGYGRAVLGLGGVAARLRASRFMDADYYAQPSTRDGRGLLIALGFRPVQSFQPDLWCYQRPWHRVQPIGALNPAERTIHARH